MHDIAILRVAAKNIGYNLAESLWIKPLVNILNGIMYIFFRGRYPAHIIPLVAHIVIGFIIFGQ